MKCKQCITEGKKSTINVPQYGTTTLMMPAPNYYDEDGVLIKGHNPNTTTTEWSCSNGHNWKVVT